MAEETFEVIFLDDDRVTVLDKQVVLAGHSCKYQGQPPTKAPTATETYTFVGNTGGAASGAKCSTQAVAFCGSNQCNVVNVNKDDIICPTGVSATVTNSGTKAVTIEFTLTATLAICCC